MSLNRRNFLTTSAAAAAAAAFGRPLVANALQGGQAPPPQPVFTPIRRNVGYFTMRGGTIGYLVNSGGVAVVDSQFPAEATACITGLQERSSNRGVDFLINSHHHGDHSGGNISFRGVAKKVVAHTKANEHMRQPPGGQPPADQLYPDTTFADAWSVDLGDEKISAKHYGRAHTSGDIVVTFERANIVHMGDLMFNQRHPVVDGPAGATLRGWMSVLDQTVKAHANDTTYIFGHANTALGPNAVVGNAGDLAKFREYIGAVLAFVEAQHKAGKTKDEIMAMRDPLAGFEAWGRFGNWNAAQPNLRDILVVAYSEVTGT